MKPKFILDTNILLDLFYFRDESVEYLLKCLKNQEIQAYTCTSIWEEFEEVLMRKPFSQSLEQIQDLKNQYKDLFCWKSPERTAPLKCKDRDDQIFIDLAVELAPSIIISKDNDLLRMKKKASTLKVEILQQYLKQK